MLVPEFAPTTGAEIPEYLARFTNYEKQRRLPADRRVLGPERARRLMTRAGLLPTPLTVVQVAGSKGKGSTVLWMEALLRARGVEVGCYTSPHLSRINERVRLSGRDVSDRELVESIQRLHPAVVATEAEDPANLPTFFDLWTALALDLFHHHDISHALFEVGLGGPLDSTTAIPHHVGVLTTVDLEHCDELGDTIEAIAIEKSRIARPGRPFVIQEASSSWLPTVRAGLPDPQLVQHPVDPSRLGEHLLPPQDLNLRTAVAAVEAMSTLSHESPSHQSWRPYSSAELDQAVDLVHLPARLEFIGTPPLLLDSAHTPASLALFVERLRQWSGHRHRTVLIGFLDGKHWQATLAAAVETLPETRWICTQAPSPRSVPSTTVETLVRAHGGDCTEIRDPDEATATLKSAASQGHAVAVTGSFYLAGLVRDAWEASGTVA